MNQTREKSRFFTSTTSFFTILLILFGLLALCQLASAGKKGKGEEDIVLYNGNIVMRGDKKGGTIVVGNSNGGGGGGDEGGEEIDFTPMFGMGGMSDMPYQDGGEGPAGMGRRRR